MRVALERHVGRDADAAVLSDAADIVAPEIEAYLNGERRQSGSTKNLIFPVEDLIARISAVMTLLPGDLIATGTPAGVGSIQPGDKIEIHIDGIGSLTNPVIRLSP